MSLVAKSEKVYFDIIWKIENFAYCLQKTGEQLYSPKFVADSLEKTSWCILLYPRGYEEKDYISIFLCRKSDSLPDTISLVYELALLNAEGAYLKYYSPLENDFERNDGHGFGMDEFISRNEVFLEKPRSFLPQGTLTVLCRIWKANGKLKRSGRCILHTDIGVEHRAFYWDIDGFLDILPDAKKSLPVDSGENKYPSLTMNIVLKCDTISDDKLQVQLIQVDTDRRNFTVCKISVLNEEEEAVLSAKGEHFFEVRTGEQVWDFPLFLRKSYLIARESSILTKGVLSLRCEYTMSVGVILQKIEYLSSGPLSLRMINSHLEDSHSPHCFDTVRKSYKLSLKDDRQSLYEDIEFCDVQLQTGDETFHAHKAILSSRSPVFRDKFTSDMENTSGFVCISDLDPDTVEKMLRFLYTDTVHDLDNEKASELYFAAEKYQIESLKDLCSSYLGDHLDTSNVCEVLVLANFHNDVRLKKVVEGFIFLNEFQVLRSKEWIDLKESNTRLVADIMRVLCLKRT